MTLASDPAAPTLERLRPVHLPELLRWLQRDPVLHVYLTALALRDSLAAPHDETWAARRLGEIVGVLHLGGRSGAVLPHGSDPDAFRQLAEVARMRREALPPRLQIIGPARAVDVFVEAFQYDELAPRLHRRQVYLSLESDRLLDLDRLPALRPARPEDFTMVYESGAALRHEELEEDPRVADPRGYPRRVEEECRDGHTWIWVENGQLRFRASISAATADAAQVSGVYTPPEFRGRRYATRGLAELCARLLARSRNACLFVNDFNVPALALYRRLGFREIAAWASAFFDPTAR
jgi:ribosomal protein S18 acetylase RimI-like enzyme